MITPFEILKLYREDAGSNAQDMIALLQEKLDGARTIISLDNSMAIFEHGKLVVVVSTDGIDFYDNPET